MVPEKKAGRLYRTWIIDSSRWDSFRPREGDVIISTYPKCGTTWMQRIVSLLIFQSTEPRPVMEIAPWFDKRFPDSAEDLMARLDAQDHRRFIKSHLPFDGLPVYDALRYIHVVRDGRDACYSYHNHGTAFSPIMLQALDKAGEEDPMVGRPYPRTPKDPAEHFHRWLTQGVVPGHDDGEPSLSFFHFVESWWLERGRSNLLLIHYDDLKADLAGEMQRIATFLDIEVEADLLASLAEAAGFQAMRRDGDLLMGAMSKAFDGGGARFFNRGVGAAWKGIYREADLALYDQKVRTLLSPGCQDWLAQGRSALS